MNVNIAILEDSHLEAVDGAMAAAIAWTIMATAVVICPVLGAGMIVGYLEVK